MSASEDTRHSTPAATPAAMPAEALRLLAGSREVCTPCGEGEMVWRIWGDAADEPLVLLHGGSGSWMHWIRNIEALVAHGRCLYVPDLPGFGDSAPPEGGQDADVSVAPFAQGLQQLFGPQAVDIAGFSFGSQVGGFLAADAPQRVRRLVIIGAPGLGLGTGLRRALRGWRHLPTLEAQREAHRHNLGVIMLHDPMSIDDLALDVQAANVPRDRMQRRKLAATPALLQSLRRCSVPFHAIYGEHDALYPDTPWSEVESTLRSAPAFAGLALVPQAGHWVQYERAREFERVLMACLPSGTTRAR
ncbi:MAG: hypothetical protein RL087_48 [Pseudomonadota bacterium]